MRPYSPEMLVPLLEMHEEAFRPVLLDRYNELSAERLANGFHPSTTLVACDDEDDNKALGFIMTYRMSDFIEHQEPAGVLAAYDFAKRKQREGPVYESIDRLARKLGKEVVCDFFDDTPPWSSDELDPQIPVGIDFVVAKDYRNKGVGKQLADGVLLSLFLYKPAVYKTPEPPMALASVIEGSFAERICLKMGFKHLLRIGPDYPNGMNCVYMFYIPKNS